MSKPTNTIGALVAKLFPKSQKAVSEKLATDEFNDFAADAEELATRLDAQEQGNTSEQSERQKAEAQVGTLTAELSTANASITDLQETITSLTTGKANAEANAADLQTKLTASEAQVTKLRASINPLGDEDASNKQGSTVSDEVLTDTDREARKAFKPKQSNN